MTSASIDSVLRLFFLLCNVFLVFRVAQLGLYRTYRYFFLFLCISVLINFPGVFFGIRGLPFFYTYVVLEPIRNVLFILVVWELFSVIFKNYAGLRSLSRWVMGLAAFVAPLGFVLSMIAKGSQAFHGSVYVRLLVRFERGLAFGLVIFILIMLFFISRYPIKLPRNSIVHCILYSVWFVGDAAILLASGFLPMGLGPHVINRGQPILEIACYLGWTLFLSKAGEYQETQVRKDISAEQEQFLIHELDSINELVLRAGRSISHGR